MTAIAVAILAGLRPRWGMPVDELLTSHCITNSGCKKMPWSIVATPAATVVVVIFVCVVIVCVFVIFVVSVLISSFSSSSSVSSSSVFAVTVVIRRRHRRASRSRFSFCCHGIP